MPPHERRFAVALNGRRTGILHTLQNYTWFVLDGEYLDDPTRAILGLRFEQDRKASHRANMRLPAWFSNLLPEGALREWIAVQRGVSIAREVELLAEVGGDLPGAVTVAPTDDAPRSSAEREVVSIRPSGPDGTWKFSLAGVQLKFSMLQNAERFTAPASGQGGDWIVKLPDFKFPDVPRNEFAMMELARLSGIDVPETRLVHRELIDSVPERLWPPAEPYAYAIRRFDRGPAGARYHMEDMAQVRNFYPEDKYLGTFETIASLIYRRHDLRSIREFVRRLTFNVLIRNGDAHQKNWSLLYRNPRIPEISPAYDLVSTSVYPGIDQDLGLKLGGSRRFEDVSLATFAGLQQKLGITGVSFDEEADHMTERALKAWPEVEASLNDTSLAVSIANTLRSSARLLRRSK